MVSPAANQLGLIFAMRNNMARVTVSQFVVENKPSITELVMLATGCARQAGYRRCSFQVGNGMLFHVARAIASAY